MKKKVAVLFGGISAEHDISMISGKTVVDNIDRDIFDVMPVKISKKGKFDEEKVKSADIVFPVLHGVGGEDGTIQQYLEDIKKPYVGSGVEASKAALDKVLSKQIWQKNKLPVPSFWFFSKKDWQKNSTKIIEKFKLPVFIKPANTGSSIGISKVTQKNKIKNAVTDALKYDDKIIVEEMITDFREIEISVLGNDKLFISNPGEVVAEGGFYSYDAKYELDSKVIIPANLDKKEIAEIKSLTEKAYKTLGCKGFGRVDLFLKNDGKILLNEINTIPGFTEISMFPKLMVESGISIKELITKIIELGFENDKS